ncbi:MAG TPA: nucleotidyltransferase family protein [Vicinamibacteria bacterium]|nr:nucleotidyltransferase family protein [Vicinamibacteria bacterium]
MRIVAVVLAAGAGRRMGGPKALLRIGAESFLARAAALLARPDVSEVVAVLGHDAPRVRAEAGLPPFLTVIVNPAPDQGGMLGSVQKGLDAAEARGAGAVLLHPVDHPLTAPETVDAVVAALRAGARIAVPSWDGRRGHPGGFAASTWPALRAAPRHEGARAVLAAHPEWIVHVAGDPGCRRGIDTPADYERWVGGVLG